MGRRKIEIQPITHERNRSVTFLKRKNGLFKKAYELGVLCSVDVAVIIFEERPGHHPKLFQYCSTDIHDVVQRHIRHDGEKDTRGPSDFSGGVGGPKVEDGGEANNKDVDEDDFDDDGDDTVIPSIRRDMTKRKADSRFKTELLDIDFDYMPRMTQSAMGHSPMSQHQQHQHPLSSDRLQPVHHQSKRPRLPSPPASHLTYHTHYPLSRSSSDAHMPPSATKPDSSESGSRYSYQPSQNFLAPAHHSSHSHHSSSHQHSQYPEYAPFSHSVGHTIPSTPSFTPLQSDLSSRVHSASTTSGGSFFKTARSTSSGYDGTYGRASTSSSGPPERGIGGKSAGGGSTSGDMLTAFLDAEEQGHVALARPSTARAAPGPALLLDWPVHNPPSSSSVSSTGSGPSVGHGNVSLERRDVRTPISASGGSRGGSSGGGGGGGGVDWLNFLSGSNPSASTNATQAGTPGLGPPTSSSSSASTRWERGADGLHDAGRTYAMAMFGLDNGGLKNDPGAG